MSPLDDELRRALSDRAVRVQPADDPLAGIERRARQIHRNRLLGVAASVVVLVGAGAVGVPALLDATGGTDSSADVIIARTTDPEPPPPEVLNPAAPWAYRGDAGVRSSFAPVVQAVWSAAHPGSTLSPLFGQVYEPSGRPELVFVSSGRDGARWGYAQQSSPEGQPVQAQVTVDQPLADGTKALTLAAAGVELPRVIVVAAPESRGLFYSGDGTADQTQILAQDPSLHGVGSQGMGGDLTKDRIRVTGADGTTVYDAPAPDPARPTGEPPSTAKPANVLAWPSRGVRSEGPPDADLAARFAEFFGRAGDADKVSYRALYSGRTDKGVAYTFGQAWFEGARTAYAAGLTTGTETTQGAVLSVGPATPAGTKVLAFDITNQPNTMGELLVVIPEPRTTQVLYDADATGAFSAAPSSDNGVALIPRAPSGSNATDRLQLLTGNGDPAKDVTFEGPVAGLLCGYSGCG